MRNGSLKVSLALALAGVVAIATASGSKQDNKGPDVRVERKTIPVPVEYRLTRSLAPGRVTKHFAGVPGEIVRTYALIPQGKSTKRRLVREDRIEPQPAVFYIGRGGHMASRGSFTRRRVITVEATAYHAMVTGTGRTKTGAVARYGVIAVDPRVIPLGSLTFVEGYGLAIACDTGSAIRGRRIDVCFGNRRKALQFGRKNLKVHVLN